MLISLDSGELNKAIGAMNNLYALDKRERVTAKDIYKLIKEFLSQYEKMANYQKKYFKDKIYGIFEIFTQKDGINPDIWDLFAFYIEAIEIKFKQIIKEDKEKEVKDEKNENDEIQIIDNNDNSKFYKQIVEIRLKQCRSYTIPEWDKDDKQIELLLKALNKLEKDLEKIDDKNYLEDKKMFLTSNKDKIEKIKRTKEFEAKLYK